MKLELISTVRKFQEGGKSEKKEKQDKGEMLGYKKLYNTTTQLSEERLKESADEGIRSNMSMMNAAINSGKIGGRKLGKSEIKSLKAAVRHLEKNPTQYRFDTKTKEIQPIDSETGEVKRSRTGAGELLQKIFKGKSDDEVPTKNESKRLNEANAILKYFNTTKDYVGKKQTESTTQKPVEYAPTEADERDVEDALPKEKVKPTDVKTGTKTNGGGTGKKESEESKLAGKQRSDMFNSWRNYPELQDAYRDLWNKGGGAKANQKELDTKIKSELFNRGMIDANAKYIGSTENRNPKEDAFREGLGGSEPFNPLSTKSTVLVGGDSSQSQSQTLTPEKKKLYAELLTRAHVSKMPGSSNYNKGVSKFMSMSDSDINELVKTLSGARKDFAAGVATSGLGTTLVKGAQVAGKASEVVSKAAPIVQKTLQLGTGATSGGLSTIANTANTVGKIGSTAITAGADKLVKISEALQTTGGNLEKVYKMFPQVGKDVIKKVYSMSYKDVGMIGEGAKSIAGNTSKLLGQGTQQIANTAGKYLPVKENGGRLFQQGGINMQSQNQYSSQFKNRAGNVGISDGMGNNLKKEIARIDSELDGIMKELDKSRQIKQGVSGTKSYSNVANNTDLRDKELRRYAETLIAQKRKLSQRNYGSDEKLNDSLLNMSNSNTQNDMKQSLKFGGNLKSSDNNLKKKS
jgi:hypothetical protein